MIYLKTGTPGAGKTLRAVYEIKRFVDQGRAVFARVDGLNIDGVLPAPDDWRETPEGSVVVYDEAQQIFPPDSASGRSSRADIQAMEVHRHTGHDIVLVTQHPNLIHSHVRRLVGHHEHLTRAFGWGQSMIYRRDECIKVDSRSELNRCETEVWKHPKALFALYKSASVHIEKKRVPRVLVYFGVALLALVVLVGVGFSAVNFSDLGSGARDQFAASAGVGPGVVRSAAAPVSPKIPVVDSSPGVVSVAGCISSARDCICYGVDGAPLGLDEATCRMTAERPLRRPLALGVRDSSDSFTSNSGGPVAAGVSGGPQLSQRVPAAR